MKDRVLLGIFIILMNTSNALAQSSKTTSEGSQVWIGYINHTWVSPKVGIWFETGIRWAKFLDEWNTSLVRPGISYRISRNVTATAGYSLFGQRVSNPEHLTIRTEHRPWQQVSWVQGNRKVQFTNRIRTEQRFIRRTSGGELADGFRFNHRLRYQLSFSIPLRDSTRKALALIGGDEILINAGKQITYNYFDQNRIFLGLGYQVSKALQVQLSYMHIFQQLPAGNQYNSTHVLRLFLQHNINLHRKEE